MKRKLGNNTVSSMGFGCWAIGGPFWAESTPLGWGEVDDTESVKAIHCALEHGVTLFDTADVYGAGHSEYVLGKALKNKREDVIIATKFGNVFDEHTKQITDSQATPEYIRKACDASLKRLGTDYIDLYQLHIGDLDLAAAQFARDTLEALVSEGKIRSYGWSTDITDRAAFFAKGDHCVAIQHQMNVLDTNDALIELIHDKNLASINRGPLAMGLLTGKYTAGKPLGTDDVRGTASPEWMQYFKNGEPNESFMKQLESVKELLQSDGRTLAQGAIAWLWAKSKRTLPIPGIRTVAQAEQNFAAMDFGPLNQTVFDEIESILRPAT